MRGWLEKRFHKLFEREAALYRQIVSRISAHAGQYQQLPDLLEFVEQQTAAALKLRRVQIVVTDREEPEESDEAQIEALNLRLKIGRTKYWKHRVVMIGPLSKITLCLRRTVSLLPIRCVAMKAFQACFSSMRPRRALTEDVRSVLEILAGQVAIAIEDSRLVEENIRLERRLAERERLATLGQMAATVAHEIKNPLSAIKSIAQVMGEDQSLSGEYARDLSLIVGETDRLGRSVTQLLSFARKELPAELPSRSEQLIQSVVRLFQVNAEKEGVRIIAKVGKDEELTGASVSAMRVALSNLLLNALQATPPGGEVTISQQKDNGDLLIFVQDSGPGIPDDLRQRVWEPFFTTKQRGTGLGLAIVRKRMQEAGGSARLVSQTNGGGARFELRVPLSRESQ